MALAGLTILAFMTRPGAGTRCLQPHAAGLRSRHVQHGQTLSRTATHVLALLEPVLASAQPGIILNCGHSPNQRVSLPKHSRSNRISAPFKTGDVFGQQKSTIEVG